LLLQSEEPLQAFEGHAFTVNAFDVNAAGRRLCSGSRDTNVKVWDVETGKCLMTEYITYNMATSMKWIKGEDCFLQVLNVSVVLFGWPR